MSPAAKAIEEALPAARKRLEEFYELGRVVGLSKDDAQQLLAISKKLARGSADAIDIAETFLALVARKARA